MRRSDNCWQQASTPVRIHAPPRSRHSRLPCLGCRHDTFVTRASSQPCNGCSAGCMGFRVNLRRFTTAGRIDADVRDCRQFGGDGCSAARLGRAVPDEAAPDGQRRHIAGDLDEMAGIEVTPQNQFVASNAPCRQSPLAPRRSSAPKRGPWSMLSAAGRSSEPMRHAG